MNWSHAARRLVGLAAAVILLQTVSGVAHGAQSDVFDPFFRYTETEHREFYDAVADEKEESLLGQRHDRADGHGAARESRT